MAFALIAALALVFLRAAIVAPTWPSALPSQTMTASCAFFGARLAERSGLVRHVQQPRPAARGHFASLVALCGPGIAGVIGALAFFIPVRTGRGPDHGRLAQPASGVLPDLTMVMARRLFGPLAASVAVMQSCCGG
jgi:hypothetical protein